MNRDLRLAIWNAMRKQGIGDQTCYAVIGAAVGAYATSPTIAAIGIVLQANAEAPRFGLPYGLADAIDNDGCPYQSATLATALELIRTAFTPEGPGTSKGSSPIPPELQSPVPAGGGENAASKRDRGATLYGTGG